MKMNFILRLTGWNLAALALYALPAAAQGGGGGFGGGGLGGSSQDSAQTVYAPNYQQNSAVSSDARFAPLLKQVAGVEIRDAQLSNVTRYLSEHTGIAIILDKNVPADIRITLVADRIPLATILELVARQADLMLVPEPAAEGHGAGVRLASWPSVRVNNSTTFYKGINLPWSDDWGTKLAEGSRSFVGPDGKTVVIPADKDFYVNAQGKIVLTPKANTRLGGGGFGGTGSSGGLGGGGFGGGGSLGGGGFGGSTVQGRGIPAAGTAFSAPGGVPGLNPFAGTSATIAPLGNRLIVVSEPGKGPKGEPGILLTAYYFSQQGKFDKVGSTFHRFTSTTSVGFGGGGFGGFSGFGGGLGGFGGGVGGFGGFGGGETPPTIHPGDVVSTGSAIAPRTPPTKPVHEGGTGNRL